MKKLVLAVISPLLLTSCATVFTGTNQSIHLSAIDHERNELSNVNCNIIDSSGSDYHLVSNPGTVVVAKGKGPLQVRCERQGFKNYSGAIGSSFNAVTLFNLYFLPGYIIDYASGAMQKYPGHYDIVMNPS